MGPISPAIRCVPVIPYGTVGLTDVHVVIGSEWTIAWLMSDEDDESAEKAYPEFVVHSTVRRAPKRANAKVDGDGMCEYTLTKCPHGCGTTLELLSTNYKRLRKQVISDHLADSNLCPGYTGKRPAKSARGGMSVRALTVKTTAASKVVLPLLHSKCEERFAGVQAQLQETNARVDALEAKTQLYDGALRVVFPTIVLPLQERLAETQLRHALTDAYPERTNDDVAAEHRRQSTNALYQENERGKAAIITLQEQLRIARETNARWDQKHREWLQEKETLEKRCRMLATDKTYRDEFLGKRPPRARWDLGVQQ